MLIKSVLQTYFNLINKLSNKVTNKTQRKIKDLYTNKAIFRIQLINPLCPAHKVVNSNTD